VELLLIYNPPVYDHPLLKKGDIFYRENVLSPFSKREYRGTRGGIEKVDLELYTYFFFHKYQNKNKL
jgi:hypothetical protein